MNILLLNQDWFATELRDLGHRVITFGRAVNLEIKQTKLLMSWSEIKAALPKDFTPDLLIIHDDSSPVMIAELESIDIPSLFYSVDTHHHLNFHRYLGLVFSHLCVAQKDYIPKFEDVNFKPHWLPLWASLYLEPQEPKTHGAVFLGTLNPALNPDRVAFFDELKKLAPVEVGSGLFANVFPKSQIVINQTVKGDLNFRVFEAMMSGALLITEAAGNGLEDLFQDKKHLVLYEKGNACDAAEKISYYLQNTEEAKKIALAGRNLVCERHRAINRTETVLNMLNNPTRPIARPHSFAAIHNFSVLSYNLLAHGETLWRSRVLLEILRLTQLGLLSGDRPDPIIALDIMQALLAIEPILNEKIIQNVLDDLRQSYPDLTVFHLVKIDHLASRGKADLAKALAETISNLPTQDVLKHAEDIVKELRQ